MNTGITKHNGQSLFFAETANSLWSFRSKRNREPSALKGIAVRAGRQVGVKPTPSGVVQFGSTLAS